MTTSALLAQRRLPLRPHVRRPGLHARRIPTAALTRALVRAKAQSADRYQRTRLLIDRARAGDGGLSAHTVVIQIDRYRAAA